MIKKSLYLSILFILLLTMIGCSNASQWTDGIYQGSAEGLHGDIQLSVEVKDGKISNITVNSQNDTAGVSDAAFEQVPQAIIENQSTEVDTVAGATVSSEGIIKAVENALSKAE
ncbi:MAG: FMN-binding protein [Eubacteriaceae bacterium]